MPRTRVIVIAIAIVTVIVIVIVSCLALLGEPTWITYPTSKRCPGLPATTGQDLNCTWNNEAVNCSTPMLPNTTASVTCQPGYMPYTTAGYSEQTTCNTDGQWTPALSSCLLDEECSLQSVRQMHIGGKTIQAGELPWHVDIGVPFVAFGTLITSTHVLTAAYSVTDNTAKAYPVSVLTLIAGKQILYTSDDEPYKQTRAVVSIIPHPQYTGGYGAHDIALLKANSSFITSWTVTPACMDWTTVLPALTTRDIIIVSASKRGTSITDVSVHAAQSYALVPRTQCVASADSDTRKSITADKFCSVSTSNATCSEFLGAGLVVQRHTSRGNRFYLSGVLSLGLAQTGSDGCYINRLNGFTSVSEHVTWIQQSVTSSDT